MKKIIAFLFTVMLLFSLVACGGDKNLAPSDHDNPSGVQQTDLKPDNNDNNSNADIKLDGDSTEEIENKVDMSLDNTYYETDAQIAVTLDFGKLNQETAVIVVVGSDTGHNEAISYDNETAWVEYRWLADFSEIPFYLFPQNMTDGLYDVRVYADGESGEELASITIAVGNVTLPSEDENTDNVGTANISDDSGSGGVLTEGGDCTQKQMEDTIVSYLSKISNMSSLTLGGGSQIEYTKAGDALNDYDIWTIYIPTLDNDSMYETMNSQLTAAGFTYEKDMVGRHVWYIDDGNERKGILFWPDDDEFPDGYYILMMTYVAN